MVGCKIGCFKLDKDKYYCCRGCKEVESCENICTTIKRNFRKEAIIKYCKNSYKIEE